jgi:hypothetical protein
MELTVLVEVDGAGPRVHCNGDCEVGSREMEMLLLAEAGNIEATATPFDRSM